MADYTATPNYAFKMPTDHANTNTWGGYNNGNWSSVDGLIGSIQGQLNSSTLTLTRPTTAGAAVIYNGVVGTSKTRWWVGIDSVVESGSNVGSNFNFNRYDDNGNFIDTPLFLNRATGTATFADAVAIGGTLSVNGSIGAHGITDLAGYTIAQAQDASHDADYVLNNSSGAVVGYLTWNHTNNAVTLANPNGGAVVSLSASASASFNCPLACGAINVSGSGYFSSTCQAHGQFLLVQTSGDYGYYTYNSGVAETGFFGQRSSDGGYGFFTAYSPYCNVYVDLGGSFFYQGGTGNAYKIAGTTWSAYSDERIKTVTGEYAKGLDDILQLRPVTYTYKGNDTPSADVDAVGGGKTDAAPYPASMHYSAAKEGTEFVGLIAQEVEGIFPDMVDKIGGFIDGQAVTDIRTLNVGNLFFALVNAIKELKAEIEALKAAR